MKKKTPFAVRTVGLAAVLLLSGCIRIAPLNPENPQGMNPPDAGLTAADPSVSETVCAGIYADPTDDYGIESAQFLRIGGILLCEAVQEFAAYYAEEIIPDDPAMLDLPAKGAPDIPVTVHRFSGFSMMGEYWNEGERYRMRLTEDGILFVPDEGGDTVTRTLAHDASPVRTTDQAQSVLDARYGPASLPDGLPGKWTDGDGQRMLLIREDGGFLSLFREADHPVRVFSGACRTDGDGRLYCLTGRTGWADMPFEGEFTWKLTDGVELILSSVEPDDPILGAGEAVFHPADFSADGALRENGGS